MADVLHSLRQNGRYMVVVQRVVDRLALPTVFDQTAGPEQPQLMGHRRLRDAQQVA